jgi:hypothetical protein
VAALGTVGPTPSSASSSSEGDRIGNGWPTSSGRLRSFRSLINGLQVNAMYSFHAHSATRPGQNRGKRRASRRPFPPRKPPSTYTTVVPKSETIVCILTGSHPLVMSRPRCHSDSQRVGGSGPELLDATALLVTQMHGMASSSE